MKRCYSNLANLLLLSAAVALSYPAHAEKRKVSGSAREVAEPTRTTPWARENPKRDIAQRVAVFLWTSSNADWDGIVETSPQQALTVAGDGKDLGHIVFHYKNGDESWGWYSGSYKFVTKSDGSWEIPFPGEKYFLGGTGKFANIKGTLKYKGTVTPAGGTFTWEGELDY
jgi:hypothetical protein